VESGPRIFGPPRIVSCEISQSFEGIVKVASHVEQTELERVHSLASDKKPVESELSKSVKVASP